MKDIIQNIRKDCRQAMNGIVSTSMREYGLDYKLNFGLVNLQIKALADKYGPSAPLAEALWKETTRELKILSTLIYPIEEFDEATAERWVAEIPNQEIREQICINLFQNLAYADRAGKKWADDADDEIRITGYWLLTRLLLSKKLEVKFSSKDFEHLWEDVVSEKLFLRKGAALTLKQLARQSKEEADLILEKLRPYQTDDDPIKQEAYKEVAFEVEFFYS